MSRNKSKNAHSLHGAAVLKWIVIGTLACGLGGSYVACKNKVLRMASEVHQQEIDLATWQKRNQQVSYEVNRLTSLGELQRRVGMGGQLVSISELEVHRSDSLGENPARATMGLQRDRQTLITSATGSTATGAAP